MCGKGANVSQNNKNRPNNNKQRPTFQNKRHVLRAGNANDNHDKK